MAHITGEHEGRVEVDRPAFTARLLGPLVLVFKPVDTSPVERLELLDVREVVVAGRGTGLVIKFAVPAKNEAWVFGVATLG